MPKKGPIYARTRISFEIIKNVFLKQTLTCYCPIQNSIRLNYTILRAHLSLSIIDIELFDLNRPLCDYHNSTGRLLIFDATSLSGPAYGVSC
jgi:hypothetical protein